MTLAVIAPQPLETIKDYVIKAFEDIPNRQVRKPEEAWKGLIAPFSGQSIIPSRGYIVEMVPVSDLRQVSISWPITYSSNLDERETKLMKPDYYVSHLIGHEGENSLLSLLKKKGLANSVGSSSGTDLSDFNTMDVTIELTNKGLSQIDVVVESVFSYIRMLTTTPVPDYIFDECLNLSELEWRYLTKSDPSKYVTTLATSLQDYDPPLAIAGVARLALSEPRSNFFSDKQRDDTKAATLKLIENLTVDNAMFTVISKTFNGKTDKYKTDYRAREVSSKLKAKWSNPMVGRAEISYPVPNKFIPSEEGLRVKLPVQLDDVPMTFEERMKPISPPAIIRNDERWKAYFKQDDFENPLDAVYSTLYEVSHASKNMRSK
mmetsp:Transcript_55142/g.66373  ORF Transcript_55142/g.66373 Transcript_55142/m.66373 type:complete len:376 (+) Transcript_55142:704-1831(+)